MVPRRNPEFAIVVLQEHGDWGANSAHIAQAVVTTYVNKKRRLDHNLLEQAGSKAPVEVGAVWSAPAAPSPGQKRAPEGDVLHAGHYFVDTAKAARALASRQSGQPIRLTAVPVGQPKRLP
jgi:penicillin-binding protein 2